MNRELRRRGFWNGGRSEPDLLSYLDLVALGTVADVVPLIGLNRAFVSKGLIAMRRRENVGLTALMDASRLDGPPEPFHLGFLLGPRINAGGRIGRADLGATLLLQDDTIEASRIATELDRLNRERQTLEQTMLVQAEAEALAALGLEEKGAVVVTAARRLASRRGRSDRGAAEGTVRPAGICHCASSPAASAPGSGRSIAGVDLGKAVRQAVADGLLLKGGGHAMAAGVTVAKGALAPFRAFLERHIEGRVSRSRGARIRF